MSIAFDYFYGFPACFSYNLIWFSTVQVIGWQDSSPKWPILCSWRR